MKIAEKRTVVEGKPLGLAPIETTEL